MRVQEKNRSVDSIDVPGGTLVKHSGVFYVMLHDRASGSNAVSLVSGGYAYLPKVIVVKETLEISNGDLP